MKSGTDSAGYVGGSCSQLTVLAFRNALLEPMSEVARHVPAVKWIVVASSLEREPSLNMRVHAQYIVNSREHTFCRPVRPHLIGTVSGARMVRDPRSGYCADPEMGIAALGAKLT